MPVLGFIGLGNMGGPMARNLVAAGHEVVCHDPAAPAPPGAPAARSATEVARRAAVVFLCLPDGPTVLRVARALADCPAPRLVEIVIDNTTAGVADARAAHALLAGAGIRYADAPVSGGTAGAAAGTLAMMVAAPDDLFAAVEAYLRPMAKNARHVGTEPGQGMAMKLLNNFLSATAMAATSEAVRFGVSQGLDMATVLETVNVSTGRNTATEDKFPNRIANGAFDSGFATRLMAKDMRLYEVGTAAAGTPRRIGGLLREIWDEMEAARPDSDFTEIYEHLRGAPQGCHARQEGAMDLHPQVREYVDEMNAAETPPLGALPLAKVRAGFREQVMALQAPGPAVGRVEDRTVPGPHGPIPIRLYWPAGADPAAPLPVYVNFHGSGYVVLSIDTHDNVCRALCRGAGCLVVAVDYRKAPENKFPKPTDDAWAALLWVVGNCDEIGGDPSRVAVGGDSAGGCLAAVTAQRARREGAPPLVFQLLVYPVTDTRLDGESYGTFGEGYVLTAESMAWFFDCYFNDAEERASVAAAPLRADDLGGLPPALIIAASHDLLVGEGRAYAEKLAAAGVPAEYVEYEGQIHGFWTATARMDAATEAHAKASAALRRAFRAG